ncbi:MAG: phosphotriesterase [Cyclobacterium sp.]|uniref:phosphotriesterase family protein n=1 Tax=Cyclobacterium sp. TaxID=1966343 RepID=UPI003970CDD1
MKIRILIGGLIFSLASVSWGLCQNTIMTVKGPIPAEQMGQTLIHEHVLVDFIGADSISPSRWDQAEVLEVVSPYLSELSGLGIQTLVECTPAYLGRDPELLLALSEKTGLQILTNTGFYGAVNNKYLPEKAFALSVDELADIWVEEWNGGIENTGIKPGFIKIGVNGDSLSEMHEKLILAAGLTHKQTGLTIASHTGPALPARQQIETLKTIGVHPSAFIWVHAQSEERLENYSLLANEGAWISLDGIQPSNQKDYLKKLKFLRDEGHLDRVLISHDAGWYSPGEEKGGNFREYITIPREFIPLLLANGFTDADIRQLMVTNPAKAFTIRKKLLENN